MYIVELRLKPLFTSFMNQGAKTMENGITAIII